MENGEFRTAMAEFKGAVLARLDAMDEDRRLARIETRESLKGIYAELADLKLRYAYAKGKIAGITAAASIAVAVVWHALRTLLGSAHQ